MYIEYIIIENLIINFFIVSCCQKILKSRSKLTFLGIVLSTAIAVLCPLFNLNVLTSLIIKVFTSLMLANLCFEIKTVKNFFLCYSILLATTFMFGGLVEALRQWLGDVTILVVISSSFVLYVLSIFVIKALKRKRIIDSFTADVVIINGEKKVQEKGYIDTGNLLYDPITSKPICLITHKVFERLYSGSDLVTIFLKRIDESRLKNGHYISVNSAITGGKMLVFDVDEMVVIFENNEKVIKDFSLGLSFSGFEKAMHSGVLLHSTQAI